MTKHKGISRRQYPKDISDDFFIEIPSLIHSLSATFLAKPGAFFV
jgi:hypothetical protein